MDNTSRDDRLTTLLRNPIGLTHADLLLMQRRKARLEMGSMATSLFTGVFFGMFLIAESPIGASIVGGSAAALAAAGAWWLLRRTRPAQITQPQLLDTAASQELDCEAEDAEEDESGWDPVGLLLVITVVPLFVIAGLVFTCILPLLVLGGFIAFADGNSDPRVWDAVLYVVLANLAIDLCVNTPLMKRWGIPED